MKKIIKLCEVIFLSWILLVANADVIFVSNTSACEHVEEYIVKVKNKQAYESLEKKYSKVSEENDEVLEEKNIIIADLTEKEALELSSSSKTEYVEENVEFQGSSQIEISENGLNQWNIDAVNVPESQISIEDGSIKVAVIDSGASYSPYTNVEKRVNFVDDNNSVIFDDIVGHGSCIMNIIGAKQDENGLIGIAPGVSLYSLKVMDENNKTTLSKVMESLYWCIENDMDVINMSFGTEEYSEILESVIAEVNKAGIMMIAASGNRGDKEHIDYPAGFSEVMAVAASDNENNVTSESNNSEAVEIIAPGENVLSKGLFDIPYVVDGTSIACAHVTGAFAYLKSRYPDKGNLFIRKLLFASSNKIENEECVGILDIQHAIEIADDFCYTDGMVPEERKKTAYPVSDILDGSWGQGVHYDSVKNANAIGTSAGSTNISKMADAAGSMDSLYNNPNSSIYREEVGPLHGKNNYVANLHYLYCAALELKKHSGQNINLKTADNVKDFLDKYVPVSSIETNGKSTQTQNIKRMRFAVADYLTSSTAIKNETDIQKAWRVAGMAAHLVGDVMAHRSMVPIEEGPNFSGVLQFNIVSGRLETRDFKSYGHTEYEDSTTYMPARYEETLACLYQLICDLTNKSGYNPYGVICPKNNFVAYGYKINYLSGYFSSSGYLPDNFVEQVSTECYMADSYGPDDNFC